MLKLFSIFATPLGAVINKGLAMASAAFVSWSIAKGVPPDTATMIAAETVAIVSTVISGFAASQGVQIPIINADASNGVKVVSASASAPAVNSPLS